ncbi:MAG TPA: hypothetical protein VFV65_04000 [Gemmatimonadales bacterium]|nr:hypothetical protein [Gemmatimonadales bacterium]
MRPRLLTALAGLVLLATPIGLDAQSAWLGPTPPPVIRIVRETARFGTAAAHLANERNWVQALEKKQVPYSYVGTVAATGAAEFWFIGGAESFAGFEQLDQIYQGDRSLAARLDTLMAREASFVTGVQTILASYRPDLSYQPVFILPETRHFWISTFTVRPGQEAAFDAMLKAYVAAYGAARVAAPWVTYQLAAGGPSPTFYLIVPLTSYGDIDRDIAAGKAVGDKLVSPADVAAKFSASTALLETQVLTISPQVSYVPEAFADQDKAFWKAK